MKAENIAKALALTAKHKIVPSFSNSTQEQEPCTSVNVAHCESSNLTLLQNHLDRDFLQSIRQLKHLQS